MSASTSTPRCDQCGHAFHFHPSSPGPKCIGMGCDCRKTGAEIRVSVAAPATGGRAIVQDWVCNLGLRHQGVLVSAIRGCDFISKGHPSKKLARAYRADVLNAFVGDPRKSASFIEVFDEEQFSEIIVEFLSDLDVYPVHYLMHVTHAFEVVGYKCPTFEVALRWRTLYMQICHKLHLHPETEAELDRRLNASEKDFAAGQ